MCLEFHGERVNIMSCSIARCITHCYGVACAQEENDFLYLSLCRYWFWYQYINFIRYAWHAQMGNQFEGPHDVMLNGQPILQFYDINDSKWANLGFEAIFFLGFFTFAWLVRAHSCTL